MNKIKLCGVSLCTLLAASGANAAGYTCEELIEYTSCMPGYYLNNGDCIGLLTSCDAGYYLTGAQYVCPDGYRYGVGWCDNGSEGYTQEECAVAADTWYGDGCWKDGVDWGYDVVDVVSGTTNTCPSGYAYATDICLVVPKYDWPSLDTGVSKENCSGEYFASGCWKERQEESSEFVAGTLLGGTSCVAAPAGSYSPGGLVAPAPKCPAGTYQPQSAQSSCITTPKGNYSVAGATAYTACPATGLTDKDGNTVTATTTTEGATTLAACIVDENVYFADTKGTYHYKSDCEYVMPIDTPITTPEECDSIGGEWDFAFRMCYVIDITKYITTASECEAAATKVGYDTEYINNECLCYSGLGIWYFDANGLGCYPT